MLFRDVFVVTFFQWSPMRGNFYPVLRLSFEYQFHPSSKNRSQDSSLCLFLLACTCLHGTCDSGYPQGNGTCKAGSCSPGFHGDNCDQHDVPCPGSVSRRCHAHATCRRQGNMDR